MYALFHLVALRGLRRAEAAGLLSIWMPGPSPSAGSCSNSADAWPAGRRKATRGGA
jgi:hypothetical protein